MQTITIHKAQPQDANAIAQMARELAAFEGERSQANAVGIASMLSGKGAVTCEAYVAKCAQKAVGFALFYSGYDLASDSCGFHLADIFVQEPCRAKGAGRMLIAAIAKQAKQQNKQWISLTALKQNTQAAGFYQALNFSRSDVDFYAIGSKALNALL